MMIFLRFSKQQFSKLSEGDKRNYNFISVQLIFLSRNFSQTLKVKLKKHLEFKTYNFSTFINFLYGFVLDVKLPTIFD